MVRLTQLFSANGAAAYQPGATPQYVFSASGPKARPIPAWGGGFAKPQEPESNAIRAESPPHLPGMVRAFSPDIFLNTCPGAMPQAGMGPRRWRSGIEVPNRYTPQDLHLLNNSGLKARRIDDTDMPRAFSPYSIPFSILGPMGQAGMRPGLWPRSTKHQQ